MKVPAGLKVKGSDFGYKTAEIERAAATDVARSTIMDPYLDADGHLVATDSWVLASIPVELEDGDTPGWVPAEALKAARKVDAPILLENGSAVVATPDGRSEFVRGNERGEFVNWKQLIPPDGERAEDTVVSVDVEKLLQAAKAIGTPQVTISFSPGNLKPIIVKPTTRPNDGRLALVMPIRPPV